MFEELYILKIGGFEDYSHELNPVFKFEMYQTYDQDNIGSFY